MSAPPTPKSADGPPNRVRLDDPRGGFVGEVSLGAWDVVAFRILSPKPFPPGARLSLPWPADFNALAYVLSGSGTVGVTPYSYSGSSEGTAYGRRPQGFADQVDVRLFGGDDRIRMPRTMLPPIHGGSDGWFRLKDVVADARSVRAKVAVNFMNSPKLFIDRVTGTMSLSGKAGDFTGQCEAISGDAPAKF